MLTSKTLRSALGLWLVVATIVLSGCANHQRFVDIDSKPTGATIYIDGEKKGITRETRVKLSFADDNSRRVLIQLVKPRYKPVFQYWTMEEVPEKKVFSLEVD